MSSASIASSSICTGRGFCPLATAGATVPPNPASASVTMCASSVSRLVANERDRSRSDNSTRSGRRSTRRWPSASLPHAATAAAATDAACPSEPTGTDAHSVPSRYRQPIASTAAEAAARDSGLAGGRVGRGELPGRLPVGPQRHAGPAIRAELDAEDLMQLDLVALEAEPRPGHVQPPHTGRSLADFGHCLVPVVVQVGAPGGQRLGVVLAQVLLVPDLKAAVVHQGQQVTGTLELAVREHVPVDEAIGNPGRAGVVRPGDAVVEYPPLRHELLVEEREVRRQLGLADVLG